MNENETHNDELTRIPDPDFARLPDDYGEDDENGIKIYTYEGPSRPASASMAKRMMLLIKYREAEDQMEGKSGVLGARRYEPEEIEAMQRELAQLGVTRFANNDITVYGGKQK